MAIVLAAFIAMGWFGEGIDTANYIRIFDEINVVRGIWDLRYEPLFVLFVQTFSSSATNPAWIFFTITATSLLTKVSAVRLVCGNGLVFLVSYFSVWAPTFELNQIRAALALAVLLLIISVPLQSAMVVVLLTPLTLGLHYSMIGPIAVVWVYFLIASNLSFLKKMSIISAVIILGAFLNHFLVSRHASYLEAVSQSMAAGGERLFSYFSVYVILVTVFSTIYLLRRGLTDAPQSIVIAALSAIGGILIFFYQTWTEGLYAYRILETMTSFLPITLAWIWGQSRNSIWKVGTVFLIVVGLAIAPGYWASRVV
nr:EpsG family protein [Sulfitobacter sp.]